MIASICFPSALLFLLMNQHISLLPISTMQKDWSLRIWAAKPINGNTKSCTRRICILESKPSHVTGFYDFCHTYFDCHFRLMGHVYYYSATSFFFFSITFDSDISFQRPILKYTRIFFFPLNNQMTCILFQTAPMGNFRKLYYKLIKEYVNQRKTQKAKLNRRAKRGLNSKETTETSPKNGTQQTKPDLTEPNS